VREIRAEAEGSAPTVWRWAARLISAWRWRAISAFKLSLAIDVPRSIKRTRLHDHNSLNLNCNIAQFAIE
jgi:hypothetical protein